MREGKDSLPRRRKTCGFCADKVDFVDYKDPHKLKKFVTEHGKILPRRISGNCSRHQHTLTVAVKRARDIAIMPYMADG
jgi:small subunit ribosomal protein S18